MTQSFVLGRGPSIRVVVEGENPTLVRQLRGIFPGTMPMLEEPKATTRAIRIVRVDSGRANGRPTYEVGLDMQSLFRVGGEDALIRWFEGAVTRILFRSFKDWHLFHAGALALNGKGIIIPGARGAGKSTITAALALGGFKYLSDEVAMVDDDRRLHPFPKVVSLESGGWRCVQDYTPQKALHALVWAPKGKETGKWYVRSPRVSDPGPSGHSIDFVILLRRGNGKLLVPVPKTDAMVALVDQHMTLSFAPGPGIQFISGLVNKAACYALDASRLSDAVRGLEQLVRGSSRKI